MMTYKEIKKAMDTLVEHWGEDGEKVIEECFRTPLKMDLDEYIHNECIACGGDWGAMLLSGIKRLRKNVWDAIPNHMGAYAFICIIETLSLLGIEKGEEK